MESIRHGRLNKELAETVVGEGEIVATVPKASQIVLEHGEIKGFMEAMTMGYRIESRLSSRGIEAWGQGSFHDRRSEEDDHRHRKAEIER